MKLELNTANEALSRCVNSFNEFIADTDLSNDLERKGILVALSGGNDSMLLLHFAKEISRKYGTYIAAAHVNHMIRGHEADRDESFCAEWCQKNQIDFHVLRYDVPKYARDSGIGIEEAARKVRYEYFNSIIRDDDRLSFIATAHHADDNLETLILNLVRGAGTKGLSGIPPTRDNIIRPLLYVRKKDILEAVGYLGISYVTDSTNTDDDIKRNFIRNRIVPLLEEISDDPQRSATRASKCLRFDSEALDDASEEILKKIFTTSGSGAKTIDRRCIAALPEGIAYRVICKAIEQICGREARAEFSHIKLLIQKCSDKDKHFRIDLPGGISALGRGSSLTFVPTDEASPQKSSFDIPLVIGRNPLPTGSVLYLSHDPIEKLEENSVSFTNGCRIFSETSPEASEFANSITNVYKIFIQADLASAKIIGALSARSRIPSDSYKYGGITRSVKKLFSDRKIPLEVRDRLPIVCDEAGVVWIPGFGVRDERSSYSTDFDKSSHLYAYYQFI